MQTILIILHLLVALALILVVLLQRSEGGALGIGGSGSGIGGMFSPRGAASTLTRTTAILGFLFLLTSLSLTWLSLGARDASSIFNAGPAGAIGPAGPPILPSQAPPVLPSAAPPELPVLPAN